MISKFFSLRNWVMKQLMKQNKEGIMKIPEKGKIDFGEMILKESLFEKGIDPKLIKNEDQLNNILNTPAVPKSERVKPKKSADIIEVDFDKVDGTNQVAEKQQNHGPINLLDGEVALLFLQVS